MNESTLRIDFNFRLTVADYAGNWNKLAHERNVALIRPLAMKLHGVVGCQIGQCEMEVRFMDNMTSRKTLLAQLQQVFDELLLNDKKAGSAFPDRGDARVILTQDPATVRKPTGNAIMTVTTASDIAAYEVRADPERWATLKEEVAARVGHFNGVINVKVCSDGVVIKFDPKRTSRTAASKHVRKALRDLATQWLDGYKIFPYVETTKAGSTRMTIVLKDEMV